MVSELSPVCVIHRKPKGHIGKRVPLAKSRGEKFFMEQKLRFGLKKNWANYEQLLRAVVSCFHGHFLFLKIVAFTLKSCIE